MFSLSYLSICVYCILQLGFLFIIDNRRRKMRVIQEHYFTMMVAVAILSFLSDIVSSLYPLGGWIFPVAVICTYGEILLNICLLPIYFLYVKSQISKAEETKGNKVLKILLGLSVICGVVLLSNLWTKQIFFYDEGGNYHRGSFFWILMGLMLIIMILIEGFIILEKKRIEKYHYRSLLFFLVFPLIGWALQATIYGLPFTLIGITLAAQVVFTNIQNRSMDTDYLTGAYNRRALDSFLQQKMDLVRTGKGFGGILLDIDNFKMINDRHGHYEGDKALIHTADILRQALGQKDFIARYGGDEFCMILEANTEQSVRDRVEKIQKVLKSENEKEELLYQIEFSIGYDVYDFKKDQKWEDFLKRIDEKMYHEKRKKQPQEK